MISEERLLDIIQKLTANPNLKYVEASLAFCILALKPQSTLTQIERHAYAHLVNFMSLIAFDCSEKCEMGE